MSSDQNLQQMNNRNIKIMFGYYCYNSVVVYKGNVSEGIIKYYIIYILSNLSFSVDCCLCS